MDWFILKSEIDTEPICWCAIDLVDVGNVKKPAKSSLDFNTYPWNSSPSVSHLHFNRHNCLCCTVTHSRYPSYITPRRNGATFIYFCCSNIARWHIGLCKPRQDEEES